MTRQTRLDHDEWYGWIARAGELIARELRAPDIDALYAAFLEDDTPESAVDRLYGDPGAPRQSLLTRVTIAGATLLLVAAVVIEAIIIYSGFCP